MFQERLNYDKSVLEFVCVFAWFCEAVRLESLHEPRN